MAEPQAKKAKACDAGNEAADKKTLSDLSSEAVHAVRLTEIQQKTGFIIDMDGVIYWGNQLLPGAKQFVEWLKTSGKQFLFLTNNSKPTPKELQQKLERLGIEVGEEHFYTSAISTAKFLASQKPQGGSAFVIGEPGLHMALYDNGFTMNEVNPDFVVLGETTSHNFEKMKKATNLVARGAKLIATNSDLSGPSDGGIEPACGAFAATVELATGKKAFFCGKPSPLMMRFAQKILGTHRESTCIIGDRMDTDVQAGIWAQIDSVLVMSGVSKLTDLEQFAYSPYLVLKGVCDIPPIKNEK